MPTGSEHFALSEWQRIVVADRKGMRDVLRTQRALGLEVIPVLVRARAVVASDTRQRPGYIGDQLSPRIGNEKTQTGRKALLHFRLERVIGGVPCGRIDNVDSSE